MMNLSTAVLGLMVGVADPCEDLRALVDEVYGFKPASLTSAEKDAAAEGMNRVWSLVEGAPDELAPCLREALLAEDADPWFRFDGSALLVQVDPSFESEALRVALWTEVDFADVDQRYWLETLARLGSEGHDVSAAAERWLLADESYLVPGHGLFEISPFTGALMLFGSMPESLATPALARLAREREDERGDMAFMLLSTQGTADAWRALDALDMQGRPELVELQRRLREEGPERPEDEPSEVATRGQLREALQAVVDGESGDIFAGLSPGDWALNAVEQLTSEDLDLLRRARRRRVLRSSDEAPADYFMMTFAIQCLTWSPDLYDVPSSPK